MRNGALLAGLATALVGFSLAGCPKKKPKGPTCDSNEDCQDGTVCVNKKCVECESNSQCGDGQKCEQGACVAAAECTKDSECSDGQVCKAGKCAACTANAECGAGGKCNEGVCEKAKACKVDEDCEDDEDCVNGFCTRTYEGDPSASCALATVYFGFDEAGVQESEKPRLDGNAQCIEQNPTKNVYVYGHTDEVGTDEYNVALSERRARTAADYLTRLGVDPARLDIVPKGEAELTGQGDDQDRRVEFQFH